MNPARQQQHASETARPSALERRLIGCATDCIGAMVKFGIPRERANRIFLEELEWRLLPAGERPAMDPREVENIIEQQKQESPF